jgi:hypothetical protein
MLLVAVAAFFLYINPTYTGEIAQARAAVARDNAALAQIASYTEKEQELLAARQELPQDDLKIVAQLVPASVNNVESILDLNNLAAASGVALSAVDVQGNGDGGASAGGAGIEGISPSGGPLGSVDLTLNVSGTYASFTDFLSGIERSARLLDAQSLQVKSSATGVHTYSLRLRLYWLH